jgi:hypothetical protein
MLGSIDFKQEKSFPIKKYFFELTKDFCDCGKGEGRNTVCVLRGLVKKP